MKLQSSPPCLGGVAAASADGVVVQKNQISFCKNAGRLFSELLWRGFRSPNYFFKYFRSYSSHDRLKSRCSSRYDVEPGPTYLFSAFLKSL